jgi:polyisoprenoid-binding protein YceI
MELLLTKLTLALAGAITLTAAAAAAQTAAVSPQAAASQAQAAARVTPGTYKVDPDHTQVLWSVDHMGFSRLHGMVGTMTGTLRLDPANLSAAQVSVDIPLSGLTVTSAGFGKHLQTPDLFDTAKYPTARFVSSSVTVRGQEATITGDLTLRGVTRPLVLNARFYGAGINPMSKAETVGFSATGQLKRSDFGLGYGVPAVSDVVDLQIVAAFERQAA